MSTGNPKQIRIEEYIYPLTNERIAKHPLADRSTSRLVIDDGQAIHSAIFSDLPHILPGHSMLVMNDTKVFHARLLFRKDSGALIEIFCLEPEGMDFQHAFSFTDPIIWKVLIGNARRWKNGKLTHMTEVDNKTVCITAERVESNGKDHKVKLSWDQSGISFGEIVDKFGVIPIPPYLHRESEEQDKLTYQTTYARSKGSVAAPTAGLHFTPELIASLKDAGHKQAFLTLHVGAGTFKPVVDESIGSHEMHPEHFEVSIELLRALRDMEEDLPLIAVGTTSVRTLESIYWIGLDYNGEQRSELDQWRPYEQQSAVSVKDSLSRLISVMEEHGKVVLEGITRLMIVPGYEFRLVKGILTNFHQPKSTLLLLVSAFAGSRWRDVYDFALTEEYRFLSYGDSCLFLPR